MCGLDSDNNNQVLTTYKSQSGSTLLFHMQQFVFQHEMCSRVHKFSPSHGKSTRKVQLLQTRTIERFLAKAIIAGRSEENYPSHKTFANMTTYLKAHSQRHIQIVITFGESGHPGECGDYHNTSQPAIQCARKLIFSNYI